MTDGRFLIRRRRSSLLSLSLSLIFRASGTERGRRKALALREERTRTKGEASFARSPRSLSLLCRRRSAKKKSESSTFGGHRSHFSSFSREIASRSLWLTFSPSLFSAFVLQRASARAQAASQHTKNSREAKREKRQSPLVQSFPLPPGFLPPFFFPPQRALPSAPLQTI